MVCFDCCAHTFAEKYLVRPAESGSVNVGSTTGVKWHMALDPPSPAIDMGSLSTLDGDTFVGGESR
jgi:hypothetical protein